MARILTQIIIIPTLLLTGCSTTVPVKRAFPEVPALLLKECNPLKTIDKPEVKLSELMDTVSKNYGKYHECAAVADAWQEWYKEQQKIFNEVK
jgi:hypothetical protein